MEELYINNVDLFGRQIDEVTFNDKFDIIKNIHEFKRGAIEGSFYSNELYLIDDANKGIHISCCGWRICDIEPVYEEEWDYASHSYVLKIKSYRTVTNESLEKFVDQHTDEVQQWLKDHIDVVAYENAIKEKQKQYEDNYNQYYEIDFSRPKFGKMYLENLLANQDIYVESSEDGFYIEVDDLCFGNNNNSILHDVLEYVFLNRNLFNDFKKLENGYIFNNTYYDNFEDILYCIEKDIKKKKLIDKFMNDGLTLDDFKDEVAQNS